MVGYGGGVVVAQGWSGSRDGGSQGAVGSRGRGI